MTEERTFKPTVLDVQSPGHWQIFEHALSGRLSADNLFLIQSPRFAAPVEGKGRALPTMTGIVLEAVQSQTSCETLALPFDESTVLVIIGESASDFLNRTAIALSDRLHRSLPDSGSTESDAPPIYWIPADLDQISLRFRRHRSDPAPGSAEPSPGTEPDARKLEGSRLILPDADFFFFPIWNATENRLFAYLCRPIWEVQNHGRLTESSHEVLAISPERLAAIDLTLFETASAFVQNALDNYGTADVIIPVHASLFETETALDRYFEAVDRTIWAIAEQVWFEVICRPAEPTPLIASATERFSRYGRPPLLRIGSNQTIPDAASGELWSMGLEADAKMPLEEKGTLLERFRRGAGELGHRSHVIGLASADETLEAVNAGFDFIGSDALMTPLAAPGSEGFEAQPTDLLRSILASRSL